MIKLEAVTSPIGLVFEINSVTVDKHTTIVEYRCDKYPTVLFAVSIDETRPQCTDKKINELIDRAVRKAESIYVAPN